MLFLLSLQYKESEDINTKEITKAKARVVFLVVLCVGGFVGVCLFVSLLVYLCYWKKRSEKTDEHGNDDQRNEGTNLSPLVSSVFSSLRGPRSSN